MQATELTQPPKATGIHLWLVLWKAYDSLRTHADRHIQTLGLGFSDFGVLEVLRHKGPTQVNTIGELIRLSSGSITAAVDRLERKSLVARCTHATDRRARVVHLTEQGKKLIDSAFAAHEAAMEEATAGLTPGERHAAIILLKKLGRYAQTHNS